MPFMDIGLKNIPYFGKDEFFAVINVPFSPRFPGVDRPTEEGM